MTARTVDFSTVDVFTRERFSGNPVAVIHDGSGLRTEQMQAVAREFGYSETTFVLPPRDDETIAQVRIFTPQAEVPFAGHPNIGTVFVIAAGETAARNPLPDVAILDELGGPVQVKPVREAGIVVGAEIVAPQPLDILGAVDPARIARCLGLDPGSIGTGRFGPCVASVGLPFAFVELRDLGALAAIETDAAAFREAADLGPRTVDEFAVCAFVVMDETDTSVSVRSRVFSPLGHPPEDPATGSASGALSVLLSQQNRVSWPHTVSITQGVEMERSSEIEVRVYGPKAAPTIQGRCVMVSQGTMTV